MPLTNPLPEPPPSFVVVWDTEAVSARDYADLVTALGNLVRAAGGVGVRRVHSETRAVNTKGD